MAHLEPDPTDFFIHFFGAALLRLRLADWAVCHLC